MESWWFRKKSYSVCRSCFDKACAERTVYPSTRSGRTVFPNVLSEVEGSAQGERWVEGPVLSERSTLRHAQGERWVEGWCWLFTNSSILECWVKQEKRNWTRTLPNVESLFLFPPSDGFSLWGHLLYRFSLPIIPSFHPYFFSHHSIIPSFHYSSLLFSHYSSIPIFFIHFQQSHIL